MGGVAASKALALAGTLSLAVVSGAAAGTTAFDRPETQAPDTIKVSVGDIAADGKIPVKFTADGKNVAPPVRWTAGPSGTKGYVVVMQDADAPGADAAVHWLVYNLPPQVLSLPGGMRNSAEPASPLGVAQGWNYHGSFGYSGPRPPVGDAEHHYHFQVFALDRAQHVHSGVQLDRVIGAMKGRVIGRGELVATYAAPLPPEVKSKGKN
jgi:Raf kinase inhibitor-like YbhB/YbcL family protein